MFPTLLLPLASTRTLARGGAERLKGGRQKGLRSHPRTCRSWPCMRKLSCWTQMQISHHGDACLRWYAGRLYMNQKTCYLMENFANSRLTPTAISPEASGQASKICPGSVRKVCWTLFYLLGRAILVFASLCEWPRCSVDWDLGWSLFIKLHGKE